MTIEFKAIEFPTAHEAIQHAHAGGTELAYLCDHDGRIVTVPVGE